MIDMAQDQAGEMVGEKIMPIPWRDIQLPAKLKIGYFTEMGGVKVSIR